MNFYRVYFLLLIFTCCVKSQTPSFNFQKLGSEEGLNNSNIFNIEQNQNGLIYITTQNGIYYFDGYVVDKLSIDSLKSNALLNVSLAEGNKLHLSIREEGIFSVDLNTKKIDVIPHLKINNKADNFIITKTYAYLLTSGVELSIVDLKTGSLVADDITARKKSNRAICMYRTKLGKF